MNPEKFDDVINIAFSNYGPIGVDVQLLSVQDRATSTPPGDWYAVTLEVTPVVQSPEPHADTWFYGGLIHKETGAVPLGVRPMKKNKLIGAVSAAQKLPPGFPLQEAGCELFWPVMFGSNEPIYVFHTDQTVIRIGAYNGELIK